MAAPRKHRNRERVKPVLGPLARAAMRVDAGGTKRRKLLVLIAAYADAGEPSPSVATLAEPLGLPPHAIDSLLDPLEQAGLLTVKRTRGERNVYGVQLGREGVPS